MISLAKNGPEQVCDVPSDEAGNDGQYQRWISAIEEIVLHLTPERSHFCVCRTS